MLTVTVGSRRGLVAGVIVAGLFLAVACSFSAEIVEDTATPEPGSAGAVAATAAAAALDAVETTLAANGDGTFVPTATVLLDAVRPPLGADPTATPESGVVVVTVPELPLDGLIAWWQGEGDAGDQFGTHNGVLRGDAGYAPGVVGQAFDLPQEGSYLEIMSGNDDFNFALGVPFTIEFWAKRTSPNGPLPSDIELHLFGKREIFCDAVHYQAHIASGVLSFGSESFGAEVHESDLLPFDVWKHVAFTYDGQFGTWYLDGRLAGRPASGQITGSNSAPLQFGSSGRCASFIGVMDEIKVYERALNLGEVATVYDLGSTALSNPVVVVTPEPTAIPPAQPSVAPPATSFSLDVSEGEAPLTVTFLNDTLGQFDSLEWDFGDGELSAEISPQHVFTVAGMHIVSLTATGSGGSDTFVLVGGISVEAGPAASIEITSSAPDGSAGDTLQFAATVTDEFGNVIDGPVTWAVDEAAGTISETGVFMASTVSGSYPEAVSASMSSTAAVVGTADVIVLPGPLHAVTLTPDLLEVPINSFKRFSLAVTDEFGNELTDFISSWSIDAEAGTLDEGEYVTGRLAGTFLEAVQVDVVQGLTRLTATADIVIEAGPPALILIEPASVDLDRFGTQQFSASVTDELGNELPGVELLWESTGGTITADGFFNAGDEPGRHEIRAVAFTGTEITGVAIADVPFIVWDFTQGASGWQAGNDQITNLKLTSQGLDFDVRGGDPILSGIKPPDPGGSDFIVSIRMASNADRNGEFWFGDGRGNVFEVQNDGQMHDYFITVLLNPGGTLRLDPATSNGHVTVASIKIIPNPSKDTPVEIAPNFLRKWGSAGDGDGQFNNATRVSTDGEGNIYTTSLISGRVQKFSSTGEFLIGWGENGTGNGQFDEPRDIAIDSSGLIYVSDFLNHRIQKFDAEGNFISAFGRRGGGPSEFDGPHGLAIDSQNRLLVTDRFNHRIQVFSLQGFFIETWGGFGSADGQLNRPTGIAIGANGEIFVADDGNNRIQVFSANGDFIRTFGSLGSGFGRFNEPSDVAVDSDGNVYVADEGNHRIQKFTPEGEFLTAWGEQGVRDGKFTGPFGIAVAPSGQVIVADSKNFRIQVFEPR